MKQDENEALHEIMRWVWMTWKWSLVYNTMIMMEKNLNKNNLHNVI